MTSVVNRVKCVPIPVVKRVTHSKGYLKIGSMNVNLHKLACDIFSFCSDYLGKIVNYDDWKLAPGVFRQPDDLWARRLIALPPTITRRSQNIFLDSGIPGQPELTRFATGRPSVIYIDYFIESAPYGFLFTSCKTLENERVSAANE